MNHWGSTRTQNTAHEAADLHLGRQFVPLVLPVAHSMSPGRLQLNSIPTNPEARESVTKIDADRLSGAHTHRPETLLPFSCFQGRLQPDVICSDCRSPTETVLSPHLDISTKRLQNQRSLSRLCIGAAFRWPERVWMKPCSPSLCSFFPPDKAVLLRCAATQGARCLLQTQKIYNNVRIYSSVGVRCVTKGPCLGIRAYAGGQEHMGRRSFLLPCTTRY